MRKNLVEVVAVIIVAFLLLFLVAQWLKAPHTQPIDIPSPSAVAPLPPAPEPTVQESKPSVAVVVAVSKPKVAHKRPGLSAADVAAYQKAYANAARANALLGEPRYITHDPFAGTFRGVHEAVAVHGLIRNESGTSYGPLVNGPWLVGVLYR